MAAVDEIADIATRLLYSLQTTAPRKNREEEVAKARASRGRRDSALEFAVLPRAHRSPQLLHLGPWRESNARHSTCDYLRQLAFLKVNPNCKWMTCAFIRQLAI